MNNTKTWHCECLSCHGRYYDSVTVIHSAGRDWEDSSSFCPLCGQPNESSSEYTLHEGRIHEGIWAAELAAHAAK